MYGVVVLHARSDATPLPCVPLCAEQHTHRQYRSTVECAGGAITLHLSKASINCECGESAGVLVRPACGGKHGGEHHDNVCCTIQHQSARNSALVHRRRC